ncbi:hypothetical protein GH733_012091 [Mirounga leonina]|nr:hypothetical protein GH733_012091 [Mirounga leonina]
MRVSSCGPKKLLEAQSRFSLFPRPLNHWEHITQTPALASATATGAGGEAPQFLLLCQKFEPAYILLLEGWNYPNLQLEPGRMAPATGGEKGHFAINEVVTTEHTINIHKHIQRVGFKKLAPHALKEIQKFAMKGMGTPELLKLRKWPDAASTASTPAQGSSAKPLLQQHDGGGGRPPSSPQEAPSPQQQRLRQKAWGEAAAPPLPNLKGPGNRPASATRPGAASGIPEPDSMPQEVSRHTAADRGSQ